MEHAIYMSWQSAECMHCRASFFSKTGTQLSEGISPAHLQLSSPSSFGRHSMISASVSSDPVHAQSMRMFVQSLTEHGNTRITW